MRGVWQFCVQFLCIDEYRGYHVLEFARKTAAYVFLPMYSLTRKSYFFQTIDPHLPILGNVEGPLELKMGLLVVVDKAGNGVVVAAGEHTRGRLLLLD